MFSREVSIIYYLSCFQTERCIYLQKVASLIKSNCAYFVSPFKMFAFLRFNIHADVIHFLQGRKKVLLIVFSFCIFPHLLTTI